VEVRDKPRKRFLRAGFKFLDKSRFLGLKRERADKIAHGETCLQFSLLPHYRNSCTPGIRQSRTVPNSSLEVRQIELKRRDTAAAK
jgi:hypothetical protein